MRYALIGCGRIAPNHIKAAAENGFETTAVCDTCKNHIDKMFVECSLSNSGKIHRYCDYCELYDKEKPDIVSVALPSGLHAQAALSAIERGIDVIIEKPMALSIEDADKIIALSEEKGVVVSVCHQNRFNSAVQQLRAALEKGRFGKLSHAAVTVRWARNKAYYDQASWRGKFESDGGVLMNQSIHGIDLLCWMCGGELIRVYGKTVRRFHPYIEAEDAGAAVLEFKNGVIATVEGSVNVCENDMEEHLALFGERGTVKLGGICANSIEFWHFLDNPLDTMDGFHEKALNVYGNGHTSLFKDVAEAVKEKRKPYVDAYAGKAALAAVLAIYKSSASGRAVELPLKKCSSGDFKGMFDK